MFIVNNKEFVDLSPLLLFFFMPAGLICDVLRNLVPFVQFKKREKHPWGSVTLSKVAGF